MIVVTGGAAFIGANFVLDRQRRDDGPVLNVDKPTRAGNMPALRSLNGDSRHMLARGDIGDRAALDALFARHEPSRCALRCRESRQSFDRWLRRVAQANVVVRSC